VRLGFNYRMDELSAALGASQLRRIDALLERRARVAELYTERLREVPDVRPPLVRPHVTMSWFVYVVTLRAGLDGAQALAAAGIPSRGYFPPVHLQPYIAAAGGGGDVRAAALPVTESIAGRTIALPFHGGLGPAEVDRVVAGLRAAIDEGGGSP
jgi:perosamine synthetase